LAATGIPLRCLVHKPQHGCEKCFQGLSEKFHDSALGTPTGGTTNRPCARMAVALYRILRVGYVVAADFVWRLHFALMVYPLIIPCASRWNAIVSPSLRRPNPSRLARANGVHRRLNLVRCL
jgi:hypothetical protein